MAGLDQSSTALANGLAAALHCQTVVPDCHLLIREHGPPHKKGPGPDHLPGMIARTFGCLSATGSHLITKPTMMSHLFAMVQPHMALESAPYVSVATSTISENAELRNYGTAQRTKHEETNRDVLSVLKVLHYVSTGSSTGAVNRLPIPRITTAQAAEKPITVLNPVLAERKIRGITPYKSTSWSEELSKHGLVGKYPNLVSGIIQGFNLGIPTILQTYTPNNHTSIT